MTSSVKGLGGDCTLPKKPRKSNRQLEAVGGDLAGASFTILGGIRSIITPLANYPRALISMHRITRRASIVMRGHSDQIRLVYLRWCEWCTKCTGAPLKTWPRAVATQLHLWSTAAESIGKWQLVLPSRFREQRIRRTGSLVAQVGVSIAGETADRGPIPKKPSSR